MYSFREKQKVLIKKSIDQKFLYIIDVGHGYSDKKCGNNNSVVDGDECFWEWEYCNEIAKLLMEEMDALNIYYKRVSDPTEKNETPRKRISIINDIRDEYVGIPMCLISIHANTSKSTTSNGFEVFTNIKKFKNPKDREKQTKIAQFFVDGFRKHIPDVVIRGSGDFDYKRSSEAKVGDIGVLKQTMDVFSVLTENGFYSNPKEREKMKTLSFKKKVAKAHLDAILQIEKIAQ